MMDNGASTKCRDPGSSIISLASLPMRVFGPTISSQARESSTTSIPKYFTRPSITKISTKSMNFGPSTKVRLMILR